MMRSSYTSGSRRIVIFAAITIAAMLLDVASAQQSPAALGVMETPIANLEGAEFPWPTIEMADGLSAKEQEKVFSQVGLRASDVTKNSVVARVKISPKKKLKVDGGAFRQYSYYFGVYGTMSKLQDKKLLGAIFGAGKQGGGRSLGEEGDDQYDFSNQEEVLDKLNLELVTRSNHHTSRADDDSVLSLLSASHVVGTDPKEQEKTTWASVKTPDEKHPYLGMGVLMKATPVVDTPDCLFVEIHLVFFEPTDWFGGKNLMGSKLPIVIQDQVRSLRRGLVADKKKAH